MFTLSIYLRASDRFQDRLLKAVPQPFCLAGIGAEKGGGDFGGFSHRNDGRNILRASAACAFLTAAKPRREARAFVDVKGSDTFRTMEFVSRHRKKLHAELANIERELADSLHRIHVQGDLPCTVRRAISWIGNKTPVSLLAHNSVTKAVSGRIADSSRSISRRPSSSTGSQVIS